MEKKKKENKVDYLRFYYSIVHQVCTYSYAKKYKKQCILWQLSEDRNSLLILSL